MKTDYTYFYGPGTCALAGIITLNWLRLPHQLVRVEGASVFSDEWRRINPSGKVPALRTEDGWLFENSAILVHLGDRTPDLNLVPKPGTRERDVMNQWLSFLGSEFHTAFWPWFMPQRYTTNESDLDNVKAAAVLMLQKKYAVLDQHLAGRTTMLTERCVLDPYLFAMARWGERILDIGDYPNVHRLMTALRDDPIVIQALALESGEDVAFECSEGHIKLEEYDG